MNRIGSLMLILATLCSTESVSAQETSVTRHQVYGHKDGMAMYYDVEIPTKPNGLGIIFIVSGGFASGEDNLNITKPFWNVLLANGYTLFEIYHPAYPAYRIPDIFNALKIGVQHIQDNSKTFRVDNTRLGIFGISSGGHLALLLSMSVESGERSERDIKAVVAMMAPVDIRDLSPEQEFFGARYLDFDPALIPAVSPVDYVSADDPPTLLINGTRDRVINFAQNGERMQSLLEEAGVENKLLPVDADHEIYPEPILSYAHSAIISWFANHL